jgi:hypothetical protein
MLNKSSKKRDFLSLDSQVERTLYGNFKKPLLIIELTINDISAIASELRELGSLLEGETPFGRLESEETYH